VPFGIPADLFQATQPWPPSRASIFFCSRGPGLIWSLFIPEMPNGHKRKVATGFPAVRLPPAGHFRRLARVAGIALVQVGAAGGSGCCFVVVAPVGWMRRVEAFVIWIYFRPPLRAGADAWVLNRVQDARTQVTTPLPLAERFFFGSAVRQG